MIADGIALGARILTLARVRRECPAPPPGPHIFFANHASHFDFAVLRLSLPRPTHPVAAADYWQANAFRRFLSRQIFDAVLVDRTTVDRSRDPLATMLAALDRGHSLLLFPEGTRGDGRHLLPFRSGIYHLATQRPHCALYPIRIDHRWSGWTITFRPPTRLEQNEPKPGFLVRLRELVA
jgi:1-acyl-sn-glycerol-3-phosphate acyltransferase